MEEQRPIKIRHFSPTWLDDENLREWLEAILDDREKAKCRACNDFMQAHITAIKRHGDSRKHERNFQIFRQRVENEQIEAREMTFQQQVKKAELHLAALYAENMYSFNSCKKLDEVCKHAFPNSPIAQSISIKRTKMRALITDVLGETHKQKLQGILEAQKFSVLVDETTDIATEKSACVIVRFYDEDTDEVKSLLWDLIPIYNETDMTATAEHLYNIIIGSFENVGVNVDNIIGFASDGCSTMMGSRNSVASRFLENFPGITIMKCLCHSLHLCASNACKMLPDECEQLCKIIYSYFRNSAKRQNELKEFQAFVDAEIHKVLRLSQTRWLSLEKVVKRLLTLWNSLQLYFNDQWLAQHIVYAEPICNALNDPFVKCYFYFISYIMKHFNDINMYFQTQSVVLHTLYEKTSSLYICFLRCFMRLEVVNRDIFHQIDPSDETLYKPLDRVSVGSEARNLLRQHDNAENADKINDFRRNVQKFFIRGAIEMKARLDFGNEQMKKISFLSPDFALSDEFHVSLDDEFYDIVELFPRILLGHENPNILQDRIVYEWNQLSLEHFPPEIVNEENVTTFWRRIRDYKDPTGNAIYFNIGQFSLNLLCLPHANADCERLFSKLTWAKTKYRNRMTNETMKGVLLASDCIHQAGGSGAFVPDDDMLAAFNANMYSFKRPRVDGDPGNESDSDG